MENYIISTYLFYLPLAVTIVTLVARVFFKNSIVFMMDIFSNRRPDCKEHQSAF